MRLLSLALRRDPIEILATLAPEPGAFLLEVPDAERPIVLLGCAPIAELCVAADGASTTLGGRGCVSDPLAAIERFVAEGPEADSTLPFPLAGGTVGYLAYELGRFTVDARVPAPRPPLPLAVLRRYDPVLVYDRRRRQYTLLCRTAASARAPWLERLAAPPRPIPSLHPGPPLGSLLPPSHHLGAVRRILDYLAAGDVYQVNLTQPYETTLGGPAWALYAALAARHPVPYGAFLDLGGAVLAMNSPELFLRRRGGLVETRPIKGTRPRGTSPGHDQVLAAELAEDAKERAEHVMIVDLERNDLGRVCETGSVAVEALARLESHPSVHHLVSVVRGRIRREVGLAALLRATFPGGSITGAPKVRAMQIIGELEPYPRGPYTGAIGLFDARGDVELGLAIRTAVVGDGRVRWSAGGGIVAESDPERELAEAWLKTAALRLALGTEPGGAAAQCSSG